MIFVTVGTQDKPFNRLCEYLEKTDIKDEVIIQSGFTKYKTNKYTVLEYIDQNTFDDYMKKADTIITHGGVGTIMKGLKNNKKIIACARLLKYGEHQNDHQLQIIKAFKEQGYILELDEENNLGDLLNELKSFTPKKLESNQTNFINKLEGYIETL